MTGFLNTLCTILHIFLYDQKVYDLKIFFCLCFDIQTILYYDLLNKYVIYKFNQYTIKNIKDYSFGDFIQINLANFEINDFNEFDNVISEIIRDYYYLHGF